MKKGLKITAIVIMSLVFVFSTIFNIFTFKSSYASLLFVDDENKYEAMAELATYHIDSIYNGEKVNTGITVKGKNVEGCNSFESQYYVESDGSVNVKIVCSKDGETSTYYYTDSYLYTENKDGKTAQPMSYYEFINDYPGMHNLDVDLINKEVKDTNTKIAFSVSPFYLLAISYEYNKGDSNYQFKYDLKGRLRNVKITNEKTTTLQINYVNKDIDFPDLTKFK